MTIVDLANQAVTSLQDAKDHLAEMLGEAITENLWLTDVADRMFDDCVSLRQACDRLSDMR